MKFSTLLLSVLLLTTVSWGQAKDEPILSGETQAFSDKANHLAVEMPKEYKTTVGTGPVLMFQGPLYRGGSLSLHINTVPMASMSSDQLYKMNYSQKKADTFYTDLKEVTTTGGRAFSFKEVNTERDGSAKADDAIHRWHLLAFGQGNMYNIVLAGSFGCFKDPVVTKAYNAIIASFRIE